VLEDVAFSDVLEVDSDVVGADVLEVDSAVVVADVLEVDSDVVGADVLENVVLGTGVVGPEMWWNASSLDTSSEFQSTNTSRPSPLAKFAEIVTRLLSNSNAPERDADPFSMACCTLCLRSFKSC